MNSSSSSSVRFLHVKLDVFQRLWWSVTKLSLESITMSEEDFCSYNERFTLRSKQSNFNAHKKSIKRSAWSCSLSPFQNAYPKHRLLQLRLSTKNPMDKLANLRPNAKSILVGHTCHFYSRIDFRVPWSSFAGFSRHPFLNK